MHKSKLYLLAIDVNDLDACYEFWSKALNATPDPSEEHDSSFHRRLRLPNSEEYLFLRKVREKKHSINHMHLDIAADDIEAEKNRLISLGAKCIRFIDDFHNSFYLMEDPDGNEFCVVTPEHQSIFKNANIWE